MNDMDISVSRRGRRRRRRRRKWRHIEIAVLGDFLTDKNKPWNTEGLLSIHASVSSFIPLLDFSGPKSGLSNLKSGHSG